MLIPGRIGFIAGPIIIIGIFIAMNVVGCMAAGWIEDMSHRDEKLEQHIGKLVKIEFKNKVGAYVGEKTIVTGILYRNIRGFRPYGLATKEFDYVFTKSEVKKIEEVK